MGVHLSGATVPSGTRLATAGDSYGVPGVDSVTIHNKAITAGRTYYAPFRVVEPVTITEAHINVNAAAAAGKMLRHAIVSCDKNWQPTSLAWASGEVGVDATGKRSTTGLSVNLHPGTYLSAWRSDGAPTLLGLSSGSGLGGGLRTSLSGGFVVEWYKAETYGAFADPPTAWDSVGYGAAIQVHHVFYKWTA